MSLSDVEERGSLSELHMPRVYRKKDVDLSKVCLTCKIDKPMEDFQLHTYRLTGVSNRSSYCKPCKNARTKVNNYKRRYGLSPSEVDDLRKRSPVCEICESDVRLDVDHDHATGAVRGILCHGCNAGLGFFRDDIARMTKAIEYLKSNKEPLTLSVSTI